MKYTYQKNRFFDLVSFCLNYSKWSAMLIFLLYSVPVVAQKQVDQSTPIFFRQVHLDFHTSEHIPGIGEKFSKKQFQEALKIGHVNQINVFAKCCHSWSYYPSKVGTMHPNLKFDLLGAEIEACNEIGVKCPIYYIVVRYLMEKSLISPEKGINYSLKLQHLPCTTGLCWDISTQ